jgi:hypothetical protein
MDESRPNEWGGLDPPRPRCEGGAPSRFGHLPVGSALDRTIDEIAAADDLAGG